MIIECTLYFNCYVWPQSNTVWIFHYLQYFIIVLFLCHAVSEAVCLGDEACGVLHFFSVPVAANVTAHDISDSICEKGPLGGKFRF